ncbi:Protein dgs1, mitochondrial [Dionaea muscipula]
MEVVSIMDWTGLMADLPFHWFIRGSKLTEEVQLTARGRLKKHLKKTIEWPDCLEGNDYGQKLPENASDQEMLEVVMVRYEKELMHPIQNLLGGELVRALLIQVQKLKLDIETAMLELDQILKANEINFAILAALPAFFLSLLLLMLVRSWIMQDRGAEGRGKIARIQRRLLIVEVEKKIMQHQYYVDQGQEQDAQCMFGLMLYWLDRLYHAVERHAKATREWLCLRQDIIELGKPALPTAYKLRIMSRMDRVYDCLLPSPKR